MDVNFTNSSGTQMPLANIVESSFDNYGGFIRFDNGLQIVYLSTLLNGARQSENNNSLIIMKIVYYKPFSTIPALTCGPMSTSIMYKTQVANIASTIRHVTYDDVKVKFESFKEGDKDITAKEGFMLTVQSTAEIASNIISDNSFFAIRCIAIGRWK